MSILRKPMALVSSRLGSRANRWAVLLADRRGTRSRNRALAERRDDGPGPIGGLEGPGPMLRRTIDRALRIVPDRQLIAVVEERLGHSTGAAEETGFPGVVLEQPEYRGSAAALLFAAAYVSSRTADATLLVLPTKHHVEPESWFCDYASRACELTESFPDRFVVLGADPDGPETGCGWIVPGRGHETDEVRHVALFREKPNREEAEWLLREGAIWNTLVLAAKARTVRHAARRRLPEMADRFDALANVMRAARAGRIPPGTEATARAGLYRYMATADLSHDLLSHLAPSTLVLQMRGVRWSDWSRPERVEIEPATPRAVPPTPLVRRRGTFNIQRPVVGDSSATNRPFLSGEIK